MEFYHSALKNYTDVWREERGVGGGGGGGEIHNMTRQIALKSFLHVSDNPHINFLAGVVT